MRIETRRWLDERGSMFRVPAGARDVSVFESVQMGSGIHSIFSLLGTGGTLFGVRRSEHESDHLTQFSDEIKTEWISLTLIHGVERNCCYLEHVRVQEMVPYPVLNRIMSFTQSR